MVSRLATRVVDAQSLPRGLGRQIKNAKPWQEPKRIHSKPK